MTRITAISIFISLWANFLAAQSIGGKHVYEFLRLSPSARITGLGGNLIAVKDDDIALAYSNPALLNARMHNSVSFNQDAHPAGVSFGYLGYGYHVKKINTTFQGGIQYVNYGKIQQATEEGWQTTTFKAAEYAINIGAGYQLSDRMSIGGNMKTVLSYIGGYNSTGMAFDVAACYEDTAKRFVASLVFHNFGAQFTTYNRDKRFERLPFEVQLGVSHKLKYLPLRFSVIAHQLQRWGIRYDDPALQDDQTLFTNTTPKDNKFGKFVDNFFRHFIFNVELLLGKKEIVRLRMGYNHLVGGELRVRNLRSLSGFTLGFGIKISKFRFDYGFGSYHFAGSAHHFTLSTNINEWIKVK